MLMYRKYSAVLRDRTVSRYPRESTLLLKSTTKHNFQASNPTPQTTSPSAQAEGCSHFTLHVPKWSAGPVHHLQRSKSPNLAPGEERGGKTVGHPWGAPADSGISDGDPSLSKWLSIWNWTQKKKNTWTVHLQQSNQIMILDFNIDRRAKTDQKKSKIWHIYHW